MIPKISLLRNVRLSGKTATQDFVNAKISRERWIWIKLQIGVHCVKLRKTEHNKKKYENTCTYTYYKKITFDFVFKKLISV